MVNEKWPWTSVITIATELLGLAGTSFTVAPGRGGAVFVHDDTADGPERSAERQNQGDCRHAASLD